MWWIVGVVVVTVLVATYVTWTASRVDRLHARSFAARSALDAHLARRAAAAGALADTVDRVELAQAARAVLEVPRDDRELAENDLTRALRRTPYSPGPEFAEVVSASRRVALARQVHNDLVRDALAVRRRRLVRMLRLSRKHQVPRYFDVDDPMLGEPDPVQL